MSRVIWSIAQLLLGVAIIVTALVSQRLWVPDQWDFGFQPLAVTSSDRSTMLAVGGVLILVASFVAAGANFKRILILRYVGVVAMLAGAFVQTFRIPTKFVVNFKELNPVPTSMTAGLIAAGAAIFVLGLVTLVRASLGESPAGARDR